VDRLTLTAYSRVFQKMETDEANNINVLHSDSEVFPSKARIRRTFFSYFRCFEHHFTPNANERQATSHNLRAIQGEQKLDLSRSSGVHSAKLSKKRACLWSMCWTGSSMGTEEYQKFNKASARIVIPGGRQHSHKHVIST
jgi:hypothetical protein